MNETELKKAIQYRIGCVEYKYWYIGITDDCERRRGEHEAEGNICTYWTGWKADSEKIARNVEAFFIEKGMQSGAGGREHPTYVYVF